MGSSSHDHALGRSRGKCLIDNWEWVTDLKRPRPTWKCYADPEWPAACLWAIKESHQTSGGVLSAFGMDTASFAGRARLIIPPQDRTWRFDRWLAAAAGRHSNRRRLYCRDHRRLHRRGYPLDRSAIGQARCLGFTPDRAVLVQIKPPSAILWWDYEPRPSSEGRGIHPEC